MNLNYAIFRSKPIMTIYDLAQIGSHNKREKKAYQSNPDIKLELTKNNIELVPLDVKYVKGFDELTKEYKKEHDERMNVIRKSRQKKFHEMLNSSKNYVADELIFTATHTFFKDMTREQIKEWTDTCMEFVYKDLGYKKEQVLHATVYLNEIIISKTINNITDNNNDYIKFGLTTLKYDKRKVYASFNINRNLYEIYKYFFVKGTKVFIKGYLNSYITDNIIQRFITVTDISDNQNEIMNGKKGPHIRYDPDGVEVWDGKKM